MPTLGYEAEQLRIAGWTVFFELHTHKYLDNGGARFGYYDASGIVRYVPPLGPTPHHYVANWDQIRHATFRELQAHIEAMDAARPRPTRYPYPGRLAHRCPGS